MREHGKNGGRTPPWYGEQGVEERMREMDFVGNKQKGKKKGQHIAKIKRKNEDNKISKQSKNHSIFLHLVFANPDSNGCLHFLLEE